MRYKELSKPQTKQNNSTYFIEMPHTGIIHPEQSWAWISEACKHPDGSDRVKPLHFNSGELLPQFMSLVLQKCLKFSLAAWSSANYWKKRMFSNADRWRQKCSELELAPRNRTTRICKKKADTETHKQSRPDHPEQAWSLQGLGRVSEGTEQPIVWRCIACGSCRHIRTMC